ncbi:MAG: glycosyltransferase family 2 protein [Bacteroidetes bacterium]|nr:glycosyltransferase family 2 protein [Bacteroidota bacterium]MBV6461956.1 hypothetical protein [Flavobacteriales bacterium]WKZ74522.1 MAG: glycosyltransferase family 2 protein [Vicingaceae bacterium]MCL4816254.1 glycosyltransferase family 2 protein [Flavobacteriales bacterium]NOG95137.1 glycosyltransferase family 2 protein [Bacteroidota bacterium]
MKTAVVILNWNGKKLLQKFLPSVIQFSPSASIYVIDNCSNDDSISLIKEQFPQVKIIQNEKNFGFAKGYNEGLKKINAPYFLLLNSDVEVTDNWLHPLEKLLNENVQMAACQPKVLSFSKPDYFEYAGAAGGFIDKYGYPFCRGRIFTEIEKDQKQYEGNSEIFWASGAAMLVRSDLFFKAEGFDENFFAHMEEIDLCWRLKNMGYQIGYTSHSKVFHVGGATLQYDSPNKTYLNFRNNLLTLLKNLPQQKLFLILLIRMLLDGTAAIKFLLELKFLYVWAIFKAHLSFYKNFYAYYKRRTKKEILQTNGIFEGSIVVQFFIKKTKTFSQLEPTKFS